MPTSLTVIVAATTHLGIGLSGGLPWRLPSEMSYFARTTKRIHPPSPPSPSPLLPSSSPTTPTISANAVIMGRKTWSSIPPKFRPLPDRINIVITRDPKSLTSSSSNSNTSTTKIPTTTSTNWGPYSVGSLDEGLELLSSSSSSFFPTKDNSAIKIDRIFVIGGAEIYKLALAHPRTKRVLLTEVRKLHNSDNSGARKEEEEEGQSKYDTDHNQRDEFECDTFLEEFRREGQGWRRKEYTELCEFVGEEVPKSVQVDKGIGFEYQLWEKDADRY